MTSELPEEPQLSLDSAPPIPSAEFPVNQTACLKPATTNPALEARDGLAKIGVVINYDGRAEEEM